MLLFCLIPGIIILYDSKTSILQYYSSDKKFYVKKKIII